MTIPLVAIALATAGCGVFAWAVDDDQRVAAINHWLEQRKRRP